MLNAAYRFVGRYFHERMWIWVCWYTKASA